ncbi:MAG: MarR family transcriptional regulator [Chloroflexaceae bacterium]|nr:MarR family transcriptional regulator [Chloroflexaceae bacterium]NJL33397.1 MarR family transcriptional regulator [Chloroflexaceae bacterium]NJO08076.1 MarR family transcriptional regulator [Chloroflexaceae bacterium]
MNEPINRARPGTRQAAVLAWIRLARVYNKINAVSARQFRNFELSQAQFDVLAQVGAAGGISQQELADKLLVTKGNISQLLSRMEQNSLIQRCQEGRANLLYLTEAGQELAKVLVPEHEHLIARLMAALCPEEQQQLLALLRKLDHALE